MKSWGKEGKAEDVDVGGIIFRKLTAEKKLNDIAVSDRESFGHIWESWLFDALEEHLKQHRGMIIHKVRDRIQNLDVVGRKVLGEGVRNPEGRWGGYYRKMRF